MEKSGSNLSDEEIEAATEHPSLYAAEPVAIDFHDGKMWVTLADGRTIGTPLAWYPRLMQATQTERETVLLSPMGIRFPLIDEDLSIEGMLTGRKPTQQIEALWNL